MSFVQQVVFSVAEPLLNKALSYDLESSKKLVNLEHKRFGLSLTDLGIELAFYVTKGRICFSSDISDPDCYVQTDFPQLEKLSDAALLTQLIKQDAVTLEGDLSIAQDYAKLLLNNEINWQVLLADYIGDAMSYRFMNALNRIIKLSHRKKQDAEYTLVSALVDEVKLVPDSLELAEFNDQVIELEYRAKQLNHLINNIKVSNEIG